MNSSKKLIISVITFIFFVINSEGLSDWKQDSQAIKTSGGENHTLILTKNQWVWVCGRNGVYIEGGGDNYYGVLGIGSSDYGLSKKTLVRVHDGDMNTTSDRLENIKDISAGWKHSLALDDSNNVWSFGFNNRGQNGVGDENPRTTPVKVLDGDMNTPTNYLENIIAVSAGRSGEHSLAVDTSFKTWSWGRNDYGQLGNGEHGSYSYDKTTPVAVSFAEGINIVNVSAGTDHSMALDANGAAWAWGLNYGFPGGYGKIGVGTTQDLYETPQKVHAGLQDPNADFLSGIVAVAAGWYHSMALERYDPNDSNFPGRVFTWGRNTSGRLGDGTQNDRSTPVIVKDPNDPNTSLKGIVAISAGDGHSMALDSQGHVLTWGSNRYGQLGNGEGGSGVYELLPVKVVGPDGTGQLENIVSISAGYWHCTAIDSSGNIWIWGDSANGRLGLGEHVPANVNRPHKIGVVYNLDQNDFHFGIQDSVDAALSGDELEASPATYYESVNLGSKSVTLRSSEPLSWDIVTSTIIDSRGSLSDLEYPLEFKNNQGSVISGFTITGRYSGTLIDGSNSTTNPEISNCIIKECMNYGSGILVSGIHATPIIKNNFIFGNGTSGAYNGIELSGAGAGTVIRNNTIAANSGYGIKRVDGNDPCVSNCIIWGNDDGSLHGTFNNITYSCIQGEHSGTGNIDDDPCFVNSNAGNYHLTFFSPCIDAGDSNVVEAGEIDIDGEPRRMGECTELVDMGADEVFYPNCWNHPCQCHGDINGDCNVTLADFQIFKEVFGGSYNPCADFDRDGDIDLADFQIFKVGFALGTVERNCVCGGDWPPAESRAQGAGESSSGSEQLIEEMLEWLEEYQPPGWEEFIKQLSE
jgi:alpha-tubulin suppressor-like RCC1 family protein